MLHTYIYIIDESIFKTSQYSSLHTHRVCQKKPETLHAFICVAQMPQPGVGVEGVACLPSAVGRLCLRLVQYLQCQKETEIESESRGRECKERMS